MIQINNISYAYENSYAIKDLSLDINNNEFIVILGENGSGKSTLCKLIAGIIEPTNGNIQVNSIDTKNKKSKLDLRKNIGIVFQNPDNQIIFNNVHDELIFGMKNIGIDQAIIENKILESLELMDMQDYINSNTFELSGGQKQRIAISSILAMQPNILVLDEPTSMLDSKSKVNIQKKLAKLNKDGYTIIYSTNIVDEIFLADRIIILDKGKIAKITTPKEVENDTKILTDLNIEIPSILKIKENLAKKGINVELSTLMV